MNEWEGLSPETIALHAGRGAPEPGAPVNVPPVLTSIYREGGELYYARNGNPTWTAFEEALGALEGGRALAFSSGMAAENAVFDTLPAGSVVVAPDTAYYGTLVTLERRAARGVLEVRTVDVTETQAVVPVLDGADLLWLESPSNPLLGICDIETLSAEAARRSITTVVDSTFATPMLQNPLALGADIVIHSVTKFISGHSDIVMGALVTADEDLYQGLLDGRTSGGAIPGPLETYLALRGLRTLPVRLEKAQANAIELARRLSDHPKVAEVLYPGLEGHPAFELGRRQMRGPGAMLSFLVTGGAAEADRVCAATRVISNLTSLGAVETIMERRARHPGEEAAPDNLIRMSVGCEALEDLWRDLEAALG
jgi:cystathionine gamma-synthase